MTKLHISQSAGSGTPSGIKVCIFGGNSNIATAIGGLLVTRGCPTVFVHRNALDPIMPDGLDSHSSKNNPYYTLVNPFLVPVTVPSVILLNKRHYLNLKSMLKLVTDFFSMYWTYQMNGM